MVNARRGNWSSYGYTVFWSLFMAGCLLSIVLSTFGTKRSKFELELMGPGLSNTVAPQNLASAPESFRLSLRVEAPDVAVEEITQTKAWADLQESVSAYAQRLELMERQKRYVDKQRLWLSGWVTGLTLVFAIGMVSTLQHMKKTKRADALLSPSAIGDCS